MKRRLVMVGDSHTWTFGIFDDDVAAAVDVGPITVDAFCREDSPLARAMVNCVESLNANKVVLALSMSEIDIRTHFWRDIPILVSRGMSLEGIMEEKVNRLVSRATWLCNQFGFSQVILWGAPASQLPSLPIDERYPVTGDNITRNILTHLFNMQCFRVIKAGHSQFRFATLFYHMVSDEFVTDRKWFSDTVHVSPEFKPNCFELLRPVMEEKVSFMVGGQFGSFLPLKFEFTEVPLSLPVGAGGGLPYRAWVATSSKHQIALGELGDRGFSLVGEVSSMQTSSPYFELALRKMRG